MILVEAVGYNLSFLWLFTTACLSTYFSTKQTEADNKNNEKQTKSIDFNNISKYLTYFFEKILFFLTSFPDWQLLQSEL